MAERPVGPDQVSRLRAILERHPHVTYLPPRESGGSMHVVTWTAPSPDASRDGAVMRVSHEYLWYLVDEVTELLGPGLPS